MAHTFEEVIISDDIEAEELNRSNRDEEGGGGCPTNMENEKRMRREIANSNERRRMQSINAGFQSLRSLLPHHEGEKLSKAAILQQTAQYIIELEREKTQLLSQNCQLKRLVDQQDGGGEIHVLKKRKLDNVFTLQTISDSSDEGLGSMSPEPITLLTTTSTGKTTTISTTAPKEIVELKNLLEAERRQKAALEERLRQYEIQVYPERCREVSIAYQHQEVIEHTDNVRDDETLHEFENVQVVSIESLPAVGQTQVVVCSNEDDDMVDEDSRTASPCELDFEPEIKQEIIIAEPCGLDVPEPIKVRLQPILEAAIKAEPKVEVERINSSANVTVLADVETVGAVTTLTQPSSATGTTSANNTKKGTRSRMFIRNNTSRQNLETIVEAIRHLEGDQLFGEIVEPTQDAPLALTNKPQRQLQIEMNPFLQFRPINQQQSTLTTAPAAAAAAKASSSSSSATTSTIAITAATPAVILNAARTVAGTTTIATTTTPTTNGTSNSNLVVSHLQQQQQCRPGVIVVKQSS